MSSTNIHVLYRPLRIGFLVPRGSLRHLMDAVGINSLLWGGTCNPLIPLDDNRESMVELMKEFNVDLPFPVDSSTDIEKVFPTSPKLALTLKINRLDLLNDAWQVEGRSRNALDILNIVDHLWDTRTHAWSADRKGPCTKLTWEDEDADAPLLAVTFGRFPKKDSVFEQLFVRDLHSAEITISPEDRIPTSLTETRSLLQLTRYGLHTSGEGGHPESLFVGRRDNFDDLVSFWNLRAAGVPLLFCDVTHPSRWQSFIHASLAPSPGDRRTAICAYFRSLSEGEVLAMKDSLKLDLKFLLCDLKDQRRGMPPIGIATRPTTWHLQETTVLASVEKVTDVYHVAFELPHLSVLRPDDRSTYCQQYVAIFSPLVERGYGGHTIRVPFLRDLAETFGRDMLFSPFDSIIENGAIGCIVSHFHSSMDLFPLSYEQFSQRILNYCKINAKPSQAGVLGKTLLEQIGGLQAARVLQIRGVRRLIKSFKADQVFEEQEAKKHIHDGGSLERFGHVYRPAGRGAPFSAQDAFNFLVEKSLLRAGLQFRCNKCRLTSWLPLARLDDAWVCEYCGEKQQSAKLLSGPSGKWKYRKSGLLARDNNQEGAVPVLLTLFQFSQLLDEMSGFVFSPALRLTGPGGIDCEVDLCIFQYLNHEQASWCHQSKLEIGLAECKDEGGEIDNNDISNMTALYKQINSRDIRCYIIFSKTADAFSPEEMIRFRTLKKERIPMILMTHSELEAFHPFERARNTNPRALIANTLQEMSWMSDTLYLSDEPSEMNGPS